MDYQPVMPGLVPGIHALTKTQQRKAWITGTRPRHGSLRSPDATAR